MLASGKAWTRLFLQYGKSLFTYLASLWLNVDFFKNFIYLFMRDTERERERERQKQAPCREPEVGLNPGSPGSRPGLKAALNP